jgi:hypothetical protein
LGFLVLLANGGNGCPDNRNALIVNGCGGRI